ncbi:ABC transporter ATP-binding protein [Anaerobranca gottschalkii]|uniref:ABC-2 type transport system ATP-binding protein n=1 Tax=Anaerobranca gottschalkii DSM 13577 TaxID=1120990 RepID=A0A1H9ZVW0_9FIRM|nr:ABC transporter ATP-binding protein [Anaerobranca gottschalkii]SES85909.1 ABC-2 type transport system ATP-binding protein [Anaerobranca gottschalkii DSM 13577]
MFEINNLSFSYEDKNIFEKANFSVEKGERICLLGENGAGKTTFLRILSGSLNAEMEIRFNNNRYNSIREIIDKIGYVPDKPHLYDFLTGKENIEFLLNIFNVNNKWEEIQELCRKFNLHNDLDDLVKNYSLGMKHKLYLICILVRDIDILLLDEPLSSLDIDSQKIALEKFKLFTDKGGIIIFSTHIESIEQNIASTKYKIVNKKLYKLN